MGDRRGRRARHKRHKERTEHAKVQELEAKLATAVTTISSLRQRIEKLQESFAPLAFAHSVFVARRLDLGPIVVSTNGWRHEVLAEQVTVERFIVDSHGCRAVGKLLRRDIHVDKLMVRLAGSNGAQVRFDAMRAAAREMGEAIFSEWLQ